MYVLHFLIYHTFVNSIVSDESTFVLCVQQSLDLSKVVNTFINFSSHPSFKIIILLINQLFLSMYVSPLNVTLRTVNYFCPYMYHL